MFEHYEMRFCLEMFCKYTHPKPFFQIFFDQKFYCVLGLAGAELKALADLVIS